jgi:hypothetical protein
VIDCLWAKQHFQSGASGTMKGLIGPFKTSFRPSTRPVFLPAGEIHGLFIIEPEPTIKTTPRCCGPLEFGNLVVDYFGIRASPGARTAAEITALRSNFHQ